VTSPVSDRYLGRLGGAVSGLLLRRLRELPRLPCLRGLAATGGGHRGGRWWPPAGLLSRWGGRRWRLEDPLRQFPSLRLRLESEPFRGRPEDVPPDQLSRRPLRVRVVDAEHTGHAAGADRLPREHQGDDAPLEARETNLAGEGIEPRPGDRERLLFVPGWRRLAARRLRDGRYLSQ